MKGISSQPVWRNWPAWARRATERAPRTSAERSALESIRLEETDIPRCRVTDQTRKVLHSYRDRDGCIAQTPGSCSPPAPAHPARPPRRPARSRPGRRPPPPSARALRPRAGRAARRSAADRGGRGRCARRRCGGRS